MIDFSIIVPTRGNVSGLMTMIKSFIDKAKNKDCMEFLIGVDTDDPDLETIKDLVKDYPVTVYPIERSDNLNNSYYNYMSKYAVGKNLWNQNDDVVMLTDEWDKIINEVTNGKDIYFVDTWDSTHYYENVSFPRFSLISKKAVDIVGFLMPPTVRTFPADRVIYDFYNSLGVVIVCYEVKMQHNHIPYNDISKSRLYRIFQEDIANGVFPVDFTREAKLLKPIILSLSFKRKKENKNGN